MGCAGSTPSRATPEQFDEALRAFVPGAEVEEVAKRLFYMCDLDGDGCITWEDYEAVSKFTRKAGLA